MKKRYAGTLLSLFVLSQVFVGAQSTAGQGNVSTVSVASPKGEEDVTAGLETRLILINTIKLLEKWRKEVLEKNKSLTSSGEEGMDNRISLIQQLTSKHARTAFAGGSKGPDPIQALMQIRKESTGIKEVISEINAWEENLSLDSYEGRVDGMMARAKAFSVERQYRRQLQEKVSRIVEELDRWELLQNLAMALELQRIGEVQDFLADALEAGMVADKSGQGSSSASGDALSTSIENIEYYEVQSAGNLKKISSLAEVYGTPDLWEVLYKANRDKVTDPTQSIPAGTVLVVPNMEKDREFKF